MTIELKSAKKCVIYCSPDEVAKIYEDGIITGVKFINEGYVFRVNEKIYFHKSKDEVVLYARQINDAIDAITIHCDIVLEGVMIGVMPIISKNLDSINMQRTHDIILWNKTFNN